MTQRMIAACVSVPLLLGLIAVAVFVPVPFASYHPGPTFDVLGETDGEEIIQVNGAKTYRDDGEIRMTTVSVSQEGVKKNLFEVMTDWVDPDSAVYPYDIVHPPGSTAEQEEIEGQVQMVSSQGNAIAAALRELDYDVSRRSRSSRSRPRRRPTGRWRCATCSSRWTGSSWPRTRRASRRCSTRSRTPRTGRS